MNKLGTIIRTYRKDNDLSQSAIANQIGVRIAYISMIENSNFDKLPKKALLSAIEFVLSLDTATINPDSDIDCKALEVAALQDYRIAKILYAIQSGDMPGALLGGMISILERGYD